MKIHIRSYCYGCRAGTRWSRPVGQRRQDGRPAEDRSQCIWRAHRFDWEYYIETNGVRLCTRTALSSHGDAMRAAERKLLQLRIAIGDAA